MHENDLPQFDQIKSMLLNYLQTCNPTQDRDCEEFPEVIVDNITVDTEDLIEDGYFREITDDPDESFLVEEIVDFNERKKIEAQFCHDHLEECVDEYEIQSYSTLEECYAELSEELNLRSKTNLPIYRGISVYDNILPNQIQRDPKIFIDDAIVKSGKGIGKYWSYKEENAEQYWCDGFKCPTYDIVLQGYPISKETYDIDETYITNYVFRCNETEIRLKKGDEIKVTNVCVKKDFEDVICVPWDEIYKI